MARWSIYRCKECGYEVQTEPSGKYFLMSGKYQDYHCTKCEEIVSVNTSELDKSAKPKCPECNTELSQKWNPVSGKCPKCHGKMEEVPDTFILAD